eukprot:GHVH01003015.1.p1 GENE.GHVH01003015.1~~GHVH01003015.1.p1  ORF type:complete len:619 (+),score=73.11 GHVH01003015.1:1255-3111(+)
MDVAPFTSFAAWAKYFSSEFDKIDDWRGYQMDHRDWLARSVELLHQRSGAEIWASGPSLINRDIISHDIRLLSDVLRPSESSSFTPYLSATVQQFLGVDRVHALGQDDIIQFWTRDRDRFSYKPEFVDVSHEIIRRGSDWLDSEGHEISNKYYVTLMLARVAPPAGIDQSLIDEQVILNFGNVFRILCAPRKRKSTALFESDISFVTHPSVQSWLEGSPQNQPLTPPDDCLPFISVIAGSLNGSYDPFSDLHGSPYSSHYTPWNQRKGLWSWAKASESSRMQEAVWAQERRRLMTLRFSRLGCGWSDRNMTCRCDPPINETIPCGPFPARWVPEEVWVSPEPMYDQNNVDGGPGTSWSNAGVLYTEDTDYHVDPLFPLLGNGILIDRFLEHFYVLCHEALTHPPTISSPPVSLKQGGNLICKVIDAYKQDKVLLANSRFSEFYNWHTFLHFGDEKENEIKENEYGSIFGTITRQTSALESLSEVVNDLSDKMTSRAIDMHSSVSSAGTVGDAVGALLGSKARLPPDLVPAVENLVSYNVLLTSALVRGDITRLSHLATTTYEQIALDLSFATLRNTLIALLVGWIVIPLILLWPIFNQLIQSMKSLINKNEGRKLVQG